jgi:hypothetical protein
MGLEVDILRVKLILRVMKNLRVNHAEYTLLRRFYAWVGFLVCVGAIAYALGFICGVYGY